ncbi:MAG: ASKHA domain-containing protein, partial [Methanomassiliicoccales archaeon]|nr:ASKHA domain-containing protein [Methanomassiliicoccales archaeon]
LSVAGNTTMIHLFLGLDPRHIRYEPYVPVTNLPPMVRGRDLGLGIAAEAPVYILPGRAGFVGGDITADVVASGMHRRSQLTLLIDVGTNGEVVVGNDEFLVACSTSAGPAFEGGEVASGMRATMGAIEKVRIRPDLEPEVETIGGKEPLGICGSGLIDLVAQMFLRGLLDKKGRIQGVDGKRVRFGEEGSTYVLRESQGKVRKEISVSDSDLANIIRTKAAVYAGCNVLLKTIDKGFKDLDKVYIAGGFGNYIDIENAVAIGLLPDLPRKRFDFIGNAALAGAVQTLLSKRKRKEALQAYEDMTYVELSTSQAFFDEFSSASFLPHTDGERFPSVWKRMKG